MAQLTELQKTARAFALELERTIDQDTEGAWWEEVLYEALRHTLHVFCQDESEGNSILQSWWRQEGEPLSEMLAAADE